MGKLIAALVLMSASSAYAVPGYFDLTCIAFKGTKKEIRVAATASDIAGTNSGYGSAVSMKFPNNVYLDQNDDGTLENLIHIGHPADGVVVIKYQSDKMSFEIWAIPDSVLLDKDSTARDGHAKFRAKGGLSAGTQEYSKTSLECSYTYSAGSAG